jgi:isopentenyl-diphosphate delta-isomerase
MLEIKTNPRIYCPWMLIALELLDKSNKSMLEKHANVLSTWMSKEVTESLLEAIKTHLSEEKWRLVNEKN